MESLLPQPSPQEDGAKKATNGKKRKYWKVARIAAAIGIIEVASWVIGAKADDFGQHVAYVMHWLSNCGLLSGAAFLAHELVVGRHKKKLKIGLWGGWAGVCVLLLVCKGRSTEQTPNQVAIQPDYIPGTKFTHSDLEHMFPFGYTVFSPGEDKRWKYEVFRTAMTKWSLDWENVKIIPNFGDETVNWTIPKLVVTAPLIDFEGGTMSATTAFKSGTINLTRGIINMNAPCLFIGTLSDDQINPTFIIGMRIPSVKDISDGVSANMNDIH